jgi:CspA family cold shock protein
MAAEIRALRPGSDADPQDPAASVAGRDPRPRKTEMASGTVKWFNPTKGFGFIAPNEGGKDVFIHISALQRAGINSLAEGQAIEYELGTGRDGRTSAENIRLVD